MLVRNSSLNERWHFQCDASVISIAATPNCSIIAAATVGRSLHVLSSAGELLWKVDQANGIDHECWSTAISADGSLIAVGTASKNPPDGTVYVFDAHGNRVFQVTLGAPVWSLSFSEDGSTLAASCWNGIAYRFSYSRRGGFRRTGEYASKTAGGLYGISLSKRGDRAVVCAYDSAVVVLDAKWKESARRKCTDGLYNVVLKEDPAILFAGQRAGLVLKYELGRGQVRRIQVDGCSSPICGISTSQQGEIIACGSFDGWLYLINEQGSPLGRYETEGEIWSTACSDDAALICVGSGDHTVRLLENHCSVAPLRELSSLENSISHAAGAESSILRLQHLYVQYGLFEYGYTHFKNLQEKQGASPTYKMACREMLEQCLSTTTNNSWAHFELGKIAKDETRHHDAVMHFQHAAKHPSLASISMTQCADAFSLLKLPTATASCYRRAREQDVDRDARRVLYNLGRSYEDTKQWPEAMSHYELLASWDVGYRNTWARLEHLRSIYGDHHAEDVAAKTDYTGITISLLGPDAPKDIAPSPDFSRFGHVN